VLLGEGYVSRGCMGGVAWRGWSCHERTGLQVCSPNMLACFALSWYGEVNLSKFTSDVHCWHTWLLGFICDTDTDH
jgi:hypothetical protein